ncbi:MFS transporter [soil metagenome]
MTADVARTRTPLGPRYRRLWAASALSNLADGVVKVALPLVAIGLTRSPALIAGLTFALTLPWLLFALTAGALADRQDRRRLMLGANAVRAGLLAAMAIGMLLGADSIWALYVLAFCLGTAETVFDTSAQSILPQVVTRPQLSRANARLYAAELTANQFLVPPLGGFLVAAGAAVAFGLPSALWVLAIAALALVEGPFRLARGTPTTVRADIGEGLRFLWHHRLLRRFAMMTGLFNFATSAVWAVLVLHLVGPQSAVGLSEPGYGVLLTAVAVGSLLGSFIAERAEQRLGRARSLLLAYLTGALLVAVPGLTTDPLVIGMVFALGGTGMVIANVIVVSLRQQLTPDRLLGRVNSGYRLVAWGTMPLGAAAGGLLGQVAGLRAVFLVMGVLTACVVTGLIGISDQDLQDAPPTADPMIDDPSPATPATPPPAAPPRR